MAILVKKAAAKSSKPSPVKGRESAKVVEELRKEHGSDIVTTKLKLEEVPRLQTGLFQLDLATGGGFPRGKISIVYGVEGSGKSLVGLKLVTRTQSEGRTAVWIDAENSFDPIWAKKVGVAEKDFLLVHPDNAEQVVDIVEAMLHAEDVGLIVLDSVAALITDNEVQSDASKQFPGGSALITAKMIRKAVNALGGERKRGHLPSLVLINQIRQKIGVMFGDPETFPGGNSLRFNSSLTLRLYGRRKVVEAVNKNVPCLMETKGTIKKYRQPIYGVTFEYDLAILPHGGLRIGDTDSFNTVAHRLKQYGVLEKIGTTWKLLGHQYKSAGEIAERYRHDQAFAAKLQALVYKHAPVIDEVEQTYKVVSPDEPLPDEEK